MSGDGFLTRFFSRSRGSARKRGARKRGFHSSGTRVLAIDPLESRCLLSVTPSDLSAIIVNQTFGGAQSTSTAHSVATDNSGDFVVTWTRTDSFTNGVGTTFPVTDVLARYYTDTVQRVNLPTSLMTTTGTTQPTFSLRYNDQTIEQISITGASQAPAGDPTAPQTTNISGTFVLWFNATGQDTMGQMVPTVDGGTQADTLTVNFNEIANFVNGVETEGPAATAAQIQIWLNAFAPVAANPAIGFAGSDATHAVVNAIDPHTLVVDYGTPTEGLDQSSLLQYVSTEATSATQTLTFNSTAGSVTTVVKAIPTTTPNPVNGTFALQVGTVQTANITFSSANAATTATNMQTALRNAGFTGATVTAPGGTTSPFIFDVTFTTAEPPIQYVIPKGVRALPVSFSNSADANTLSGFLPSVTISTLDKPFTISNIPFSQTSPTLTAQAIFGAFQSQVNSFSTGVAPINFVTLATQLPQNPAPAPESQNPYTAPIYNNVGASNNANVPVTGFNPTISVQPVVSVNTSGTDITSFTSFDITFTNVTGTTVDAPLAVIDYTAANGGKVVATPVSLPGGTVQVPGTVSGASVAITKQSGNEFQVNPPPPYSIYTANQAPLNSYEPAVSMDGSGDFVITWAGEVSQQLAPKNVTDIYFRMYSPVGVTSPTTTVLNSVNSDLYSQQVLTFNFTSSIPTGNTSTFQLKLGAFTSDPITFNTDPSVTAANIENALLNQYPGISVTSTSTGNPYSFQVTFAEGGVLVPAVQYVATLANALPTTMVFSTAPTQSFTGVRQVTNPTQQLQYTFTAGAPTTTGNLGTFMLQVGSFETAAINFNSNPTVTALNIQNALVAAGFPGVAVSAQSLITTRPGYYTFNVTFTGYNTPPVQYVPIAPAQGGLPTTVAFINSNGDPFTVTVNANYTNPQFQPAVAMDPYGNFVIVWANQGPDESYFNDISLQCFDNSGNPLGNNLVVNQDPGNPAINYNTDTNFNPTVAIGLNSLNPNNPITDNIVVSYTTAIELPSQVATNPNGTVYVRGYSFNPEQKQGPAPLQWNQLALANNGGNSSVSMDGQNNFVVAWQQNTDTDSNGGTSEGVYAAEYQMLDWTSGAALANPVNLRPSSASIPPAPIPARSPSGRSTRRRRRCR